MVSTRARYLELRETQRALNRKIVRTLSKKTLEDSARDLGLWNDGEIVHDLEPNGNGRVNISLDADSACTRAKRATGRG